LCIRKKVPKEFSQCKELYDWKNYLTPDNKLQVEFVFRNWMEFKEYDDNTLAFYCSSKLIVVSNFYFYFDDENKLTFKLWHGNEYHVMKGGNHVKILVMSPGATWSIKEIIYEKDGIRWKGQVYPEPKTYFDIIPHGKGIWTFPDGTIFDAGALCGLPHGLVVGKDKKTEFWLGTRIYNTSDRNLIKIPIKF
jgi:hypothetical protein